jgi:hypothetical protein
MIVDMIYWFKKPLVGIQSLLVCLKKYDAESTYRIIAVVIQASRATNQLI